MSNGQSEYSRKRKIQQSGEPHDRGNQQSQKNNQFVIQKHDASQLHFDFRLAIGGALKSWAVPKGPSLDPSSKQLAIEVEDHPLDYAGFEGVIPEGHYGAGTVMIWDRGTYRNLREEGKKTTSMADALHNGLIEVWLEGDKLKGGFALKRFREGKKPQWLLIKMDDEHGDARRNPVATENRSVKSGRTLNAIAKEESDNG